MISAKSLILSSLTYLKFSESTRWNLNWDNKITKSPRNDSEENRGGGSQLVINYLIIVQMWYYVFAVNWIHPKFEFFIAVMVTPNIILVKFDFLLKNNVTFFLFLCYDTDIEKSQELSNRNKTLREKRGQNK